jgi:uncharacterized protein YpmB
MTLPSKRRRIGGGEWASRHSKALAILIVVGILFIAIVATLAWFVSLFEAQNRLIHAGCIPGAFNEFGLVTSYLNC